MWNTRTTTRYHFLTPTWLVHLITFILMYQQESSQQGLFYNFNSFVPVSFKNNLMSTLIFRVFSIASSYITFDENLKTFKTKFLKNGFPSFSFDAATNKFLYKQYNPNCDIFSTVNKKTVVIVLPYLGYLSIIMRRKITGLVSKYYPTADFKVIFKSGYSIRKMFCYKDKVPKKRLSGVVYYTHCEKCGPSKAYIGKTKNTLYEWLHSSNGHLHPSSKKTALPEHLAQDISPACEFKFENIKS